jgi:hypothetical protein
MTNQELKAFKQNIADPRLEELSKHIIPGGLLRCIKSVQIVELDPRNVGADLHIRVEGFTCNDRKVYAGVFCDRWLEDDEASEALAWLNQCVFLAEGTISVESELNETTLATKPYCINRYTALFPSLQHFAEVPIQSDLMEFLEKAVEKTNRVMSAILVELDYKGQYMRFALTPEEFEKKYPEVVEDCVWPATEADTYTLSPLVHIWFKPCQINDEAWKEFFTDMEWGLSEMDLDARNLPWIDLTKFGQLRIYISSEMYCAANEHTGASDDVMLKEWVDAMQEVN